MGCRLALLGVALVLACSSVGAVQDTRLRAQHQQLLQESVANPAAAFRDWVVRHSKPYLDDAVEFQNRFKVWLENLEYVVAYNARTTSHWLHLNHLADLTTVEYSTGLLGYDYKAHMAQNRLRSSKFSYADVDVDSLPQSVDFRSQGAVTRVKNQGACGSCWAFATTGAVEGINALVTNELVALSEQELVDCDTEKDQGCNGGLMDYAFEFIIKNGGLDTEEDYPYTAQDGVCDEKKRNRRVVTISSYENVPENDEVALKKAAAHQPVAVAIEADAKSFQLYGGGVYDDLSCGTALNHGVLVVGYGKDPKGGNYWIIKNSWGPEWGDHGYIRIKVRAASPSGAELPGVHEHVHVLSPTHPMDQFPVVHLVSPCLHTTSARQRLPMRTPAAPIRRRSLCIRLVLHVPTRPKC